MTFLPVVARELRAASRRRSTYTSRTLAALISVLVGGWIMVTVPTIAFTSTSNVVGAQFFRVISWFAVVYALVSGAKATADTISSEKRQGTLGLLFLTDLKSYDVILGKLAASSLDTLYGVVAIIPVLGIPLLMGGVTPGEFLRVGLATLVTLLFSLSAGMFASSISYVERKAAGLAFLIVALVGGGVPLTAAVIDDAWGKRELAEMIQIANPWYALSRGLAANYTAHPSEFWISIASCFVLGTLLLFAASRTASRLWVDKPQRLGQFGWRDKWRRRLRGSSEAQKQFRRRLLDINAVFWLASRDRHVRSYPWVFLVSMAALWFWGLFVDREFVGLTWTIGMFYAIHVIFKIWFANIASYGFSTDRDAGSLEIILSTPLSVCEILKGQWLALKRLFFWPFVALISCEVLLTTWNAASPSVLDRNEYNAPWIAFAFFGAILLVADCVALAWVGFWASLRAKTPRHASSTATGVVLALPSGVFLVFMVLKTVSGEFSGVFVATAWLVLGLATDVALIILIRRKFRLNLRYVVSECSASRAPKS